MKWYAQDFIGLNVYHKKYELGIIKNVYKKENHYYIHIDFENGHSGEFNFSAFNSFLFIEDPIAQKIAVQLGNKEEQLERNREDNNDKLIQLTKEKELSNIIPVKRKVYESKEEKAIKYQLKRLQEQQELAIKKHEKEYPHCTYLAYQGKYGDKEINGQYLSVHKDLRKIHHWDIITELQVKDIVLHIRNQEFYAISRVNRSFYEVDIDNEDKKIITYKINTKYEIFNNSIDLRCFRDSIMNYDNTYHPKHSPFNKNGLGNQGYLYRIDLDLAQSFIFKIVELNPELKNIDYIQEILEIYS